jgi:hypothetical protein
VVWWYKTLPGWFAARKGTPSVTYLPFVTSLCEVQSSCEGELDPVLSAVADRVSLGSVFFSGQSKLVCSVGCRLLMEYCGYSSINWSHCVQFVV